MPRCRLPSTRHHQIDSVCQRFTQTADAVTHPASVMKTEGNAMADGHVFEFEKTSATGEYVSGWFSVIEVDGERYFDWHDDSADMAVLKKAAHKFITNVRSAKLLHKGKAIGDVVESVLIDDDFAAAHGITHSKRGWWGTMQVHDEDVRKRVRSGELRSFSIGGRAQRHTIEE